MSLLLASLSDEQTVLLGCGVVMALSIGLLSLSYHFGAGRQNQEQADTVRFERNEEEAREESKRRAA